MRFVSKTRRRQLVTMQACCAVITLLAVACDNQIADRESAQIKKTNQPIFELSVEHKDLKERGAKVFESNCKVCHQLNGIGIENNFPPLANSEWVNGPTNRLVAIILHGIDGEITVQSKKYKGTMPPFKDRLPLKDIAAVLTYIRNSWGNRSSAVTLEQVQETYFATKARKPVWSGEGEINAQSW
jgi:mono/diheme cytochrome c family protein